MVMGGETVQTVPSVVIVLLLTPLQLQNVRVLLLSLQEYHR